MPSVCLRSPQDVLVEQLGVWKCSLSKPVFTALLEFLVGRVLNEREFRLHIRRRVNSQLSGPELHAFYVRFKESVDGYVATQGQ